MQNWKTPQRINKWKQPEGIRKAQKFPSNEIFAEEMRDISLQSSKSFCREALSKYKLPIYFICLYAKSINHFH